MKNHYHLILSARIENGISKFMQKVMIGYVKYFNEKYKRSGTLFQGKTKKVPIENEAHFYHILHYVHLNPLDYLNGATEWRERKVEDVDVALAHLKKYRWSSYLDYCGVKNFPSVISRDLFGGVFNDYDVAGIGLLLVSMVFPLCRKYPAVTAFWPSTCFAGTLKTRVHVSSGSRSKEFT